MTLNINANKTNSVNGKDRKLIPAGPQMGRLVRVVDYGLQEQPPYQGQVKKPAYKIDLTFEFPKHRIDVDGESRPMWESKTITASSHEKSTCVKWYSVLDPENKHRGDLSKCLDTPVQVLIVHNEGRGKHEGKTFANIGDITPLMEGLEVPPLENDAVSFDLSSPDIELFKTFPEFMQERIKSNLEFTGSKLQRLLEGTGVPYTARAPGDHPSDVAPDSVSPEAAQEAETPVEEDPFA